MNYPVTMALSSTFTPQSSLLCSPKKPTPLSPTTWLLQAQVGHHQKLLYQSLRYSKRIAPIAANNKRLGSPITASLKWEKGYTNVEVFTKDHLAVSLAYDIAQLSSKFIKERGAFTVALSGGSLIKYLRSNSSPLSRTLTYYYYEYFVILSDFE